MIALKKKINPNTFEDLMFIQQFMTWVACLLATRICSKGVIQNGSLIERRMGQESHLAKEKKGLLGAMTSFRREREWHGIVT